MAGVTPAGPVPATSQAAAAPPAPALGLPAAAALVAAGGSVGVLVRALLAEAFPVVAGGWPWVTLAINVTGSLLLGVLLAVLQRGPDVGRRRAVRLGVGTGVLGGFTTYSTFALEVVGLLADDAALGLAYALVSVVGGVAAAVAGIVAVGRVRGRAGPVPDDLPSGTGRGER